MKIFMVEMIGNKMNNSWGMKNRRMIRIFIIQNILLGDPLPLSVYLPELIDAIRILKKKELLL